MEEKDGHDWFRGSGVPYDVYEKAIKEAARIEKSDGGNVNPWDCLTFGQIRKIILNNWQNGFDSDYSDPDKKGRNKKEIKTEWLSHLDKLNRMNFKNESVPSNEHEFLLKIKDWLIPDDDSNSSEKE